MIGMVNDGGAGELMEDAIDMVPISAADDVEQAELSRLARKLTVLLRGATVLVDAPPIASRLPSASRMFKSLSEDVKDRVNNSLNDLKATATEELQATAAAEAFGEATDGLEEVSGALLTPMMAVVGDTIRSRYAKSLSEKRRVREVAAVCAQRVLAASKCWLPENALKERGSQHDDTEAMREVLRGLQQVVMQRLAFETSPMVRSLLRDGESFAVELNLYATPPNQLPTAPLSVVGGNKEVLAGLQAMITLQEKEKASLAIKQAAWAETQEQVRLEMTRRLDELEEEQALLEEEPDVLTKQLGLLRIREKHAALALASENVKDVGTALSVMVRFVSQIGHRLEAVDKKLDKLQEQVSAISADLRLLVGRPVLEVLREQREKLIDKHSHLREKVYIPAAGIGAGEDRAKRFVINSENRPFALLERLESTFFMQEEVQLFLLAGMAGSGKSTFLTELELHIVTKYTNQRKAKNPKLDEVVLLKVALATLQNPYSNLVREALGRMGFRELQIEDLILRVKQGTVEIVFFLDGYDELKQSNINLFVSNNLEEYRSRELQHEADGFATNHGGSDDDKVLRARACFAQPKVIIATRTELINNVEGYQQRFLPFERDNTCKDTWDAALPYFLELRLAPFDRKKISQYMHELVALNLRTSLASSVAPLVPSSVAAFEGQQNGDPAILAAINTVLSAAGGRVGKHDAASEGLLKRTQARNKSSMQVQRTNNIIKRWIRRSINTAGTDREERRYIQLTKMVEVLALAIDYSHMDRDIVKRRLASFCAKIETTGEVWSHHEYETAFYSIRELQEITNTPFMVEIVTRVLPQLTTMRSTDAQIKGELSILLDSAAHVTWACVSSWLREESAGKQRESSSEKLGRLQDAIEKQSLGVVTDAVKVQLEELQKLASKVADALVTRGLALPEQLLSKPHPVAETSTFSFGQAIEDDEDEDDDEIATDANHAAMVVVLESLLRGVLARRPVRRTMIYSIFIEHFLQQRTRKETVAEALTQLAVPASDLCREGMTYSKQLALKMTEELQAKVLIEQSSKLFAGSSAWDIFIPERRKEGASRAMLTAVQLISPVTLAGGVMTFMHKTVQEYLCADALRISLQDILGQLPIAFEKIGQLLHEETLEMRAKSNGQKTSGTRGLLRKLDAKQQLQLSKAIKNLGEQLIASPWARIELEPEDAVREFLIELLLESSEFMLQLKMLFQWTVYAKMQSAKRKSAAVDAVTDIESQELSAHADFIQSNLSAIACGILPRRRGGTLLHLAAASGLEFICARTLELLDSLASLGQKQKELFSLSQLRSASFRDVSKELDVEVALEMRIGDVTDDDGKTPLHLAAEGGHRSVVKLLLDKGAEPTTHAISTPLLEVMCASSKEAVKVSRAEDTAVAPRLLEMGTRTYQPSGASVPYAAAAQPADCFVVALPNAAVAGGRWHFEVEIQTEPVTEVVQASHRGKEGQPSKCESAENIEQPVLAEYARDGKFLELKDFTVGWSTKMPSTAGATNIQNRTMQPTDLCGRGMGGGFSIGLGADGRVRCNDYVWRGKREEHGLPADMDRARASCEQASRGRGRQRNEIVFGGMCGPLALFGSAVSKVTHMAGKRFHRKAGTDSWWSDQPSYDDPATSFECTALAEVAPFSLECPKTTLNLGTGTKSWFSGDPEATTGVEGWRPLQKGVTIMCAVDWSQRRFWFGTDRDNEGWTEVPASFLEPHFNNPASGLSKDVNDKRAPLYLVISGLSCGGRVRVNLGDKGFKHGAGPVVSGASFRPLNAATPGDSALLAAANNGHMPVVELLLDAISKQKGPAELRKLVNEQGGAKKRTLLHHVATYGNAKLAERLLNMDSNVSPRDVNDLTPVELAMSATNVSIKGAHRIVVETLAVFPNPTNKKRMVLRPGFESPSLGDFSIPHWAIIREKWLPKEMKYEMWHEEKQKDFPGLLSRVANRSVPFWKAQTTAQPRQLFARMQLIAGLKCGDKELVRLDMRHDGSMDPAIAHALSDAMRTFPHEVVGNMLLGVHGQSILIVRFPRDIALVGSCAVGECEGAILRGILASRKVETLDLSGSWFSAEAVDLLAKGMLAGQAPERLHLAGCTYAAGARGKLAALLRAVCTPMLRLLDLSNQMFEGRFKQLSTSENGGAISAVCALMEVRSNRLSVLRLGGNGPWQGEPTQWESVTGAGRLARAMMHRNCALRILDLSGSELNGGSLQDIRSAAKAGVARRGAASQQIIVRGLEPATKPATAPADLRVTWPRVLAKLEAALMGKPEGAVLTVLTIYGCFCPLTNKHLELVEAAKKALTSKGEAVVFCLLAPVSQARLDTKMQTKDEMDLCLSFRKRARLCALACAQLRETDVLPLHYGASSAEDARTTAEAELRARMPRFQWRAFDVVGGDHWQRVHEREARVQARTVVVPRNAVGEYNIRPSATAASEAQLVEDEGGATKVRALMRSGDVQALVEQQRVPAATLQELVAIMAHEKERVTKSTLQLNYGTYTQAELRRQRQIDPLKDILRTSLEVEFQYDYEWVDFLGKPHSLVVRCLPIDGRPCSA